LSVRGLPVGDGRMDVAINRDGRVTHASPPAGFRLVTGAPAAPR
jgi:hypothetical protein